MTLRPRITEQGTIGSLLLPIVVFTILVAGCERRSLGGSNDDSPILAEVNGKPMTQKEFDLFLPVDFQDALTLDEKRDYLDRWITTQLLYDEVGRSGHFIQIHAAAAHERLENPPARGIEGKGRHIDGVAVGERGQEHRHRDQLGAGMTVGIGPHQADQPDIVGLDLAPGVGWVLCNE